MGQIKPDNLVSGVEDRMDDDIRMLVEKIWRYHQLNHEISAADVILVLCSHDTAVAERAAQLFLQGLSPLVVFSGGLGGVTRRFWSEPEANQFADIALSMGVPADSILVENRSANTGENVLFTKRLLLERGVDPQRVILVQKPYMERRAYATFRKVWPEKEVCVTSPRVSLDDYLTRYSHGSLTEHEVVSIIVGDLQRIREYPARGFQIHQDIPDDVWDAFHKLVAAGYSTHLLDSTG